jgi:predicted DNA-binding ribbon-helix-helix protein
MAARLTKIGESEHLQAVLDSGMRVIVHGWVKRANGRWECRETAATLRSGDGEGA